ncbi:DUF6114 domain-containing protein [Streptomyces mangrovisoli]|uniref:Integral membrane protein n=1 Tax=Streptomyces mangrovisoli TaxID=1428628 RepID=A0A1J4P2N0_9ACTN|nr:DUF6114 domain-containing protein [Streptomyces mangrovisoli]OIJ67694.1 hypothetical protein WN71_011525 [Streptomyces mangrovisoli]
MNAETSAEPGQFTRRRRQFRAWRGSRPFWAGLFVMLGGVPIMYFPYAHLHVGYLTMTLATTAGAGSLIIGVLLVVLGFSLWFQTHVRVFAGVASILLGLVSLPVANFGGFIIGFLFALIGGAMAVSWVPGRAPEPQAVQGFGAGADGAPGAVPDAAGHDGTVHDGTAHDGFGQDGVVLDKTAGDDVDEVGEAHDLSGTSPANGANGRHSAG